MRFPLTIVAVCVRYGIHNHHCLQCESGVDIALEMPPGLVIKFGILIRSVRTKEGHRQDRRGGNGGKDGCHMSSSGSGSDPPPNV